MPAQIVPAQVAVRADALAQSFDLGHQLLACLALEVVIRAGHGSPLGWHAPLI